MLPSQTQSELSWRNTPASAFEDTELALTRQPRHCEREIPCAPAVRTTLPLAMHSRTPSNRSPVCVLPEIAFPAMEFRTAAPPAPEFVAQIPTNESLTALPLSVFE